MLRIVAIPGVGVVPPPAPDPVCAIRAADVKVSGFLGKYQVDTSDSAQRYSPIPMNFFVPEEILQLSICEAELKVVVERRKSAPRLQDFKHWFVIEILDPCERPCTPVDDNAITKIVKPRIPF